MPGIDKVKKVDSTAGSKTASKDTNTNIDILPSLKEGDSYGLNLRLD